MMWKGRNTDFFFPPSHGIGNLNPDQLRDHHRPSDYHQLDRGLLNYPNLYHHLPHLALGMQRHISVRDSIHKHLHRDDFHPKYRGGNNPLCGCENRYVAKHVLQHVCLD